MLLLMVERVPLSNSSITSGSFTPGQRSAFARRWDGRLTSMVAGKTSTSPSPALAATQVRRFLEKEYRILTTLTGAIVVIMVMTRAMSNQIFFYYQARQLQAQPWLRQPSKMKKKQTVYKFMKRKMVKEVSHAKYCQLSH